VKSASVVHKEEAVAFYAYDKRGLVTKEIGATGLGALR